jgi:hypothetical protein
VRICPQVNDRSIKGLVITKLAESAMPSNSWWLIDNFESSTLHIFLVICATETLDQTEPLEDFANEKLY